MIDIASYQATIDLDAVFAQNELDGVIVKATQGLKYVNPHCDKWVQWLIKHDKPWGFYHYLDSTDPVAEAKRFVNDTINYFGAGVPCADYEGNIVQAYGTYYLRRWLETVYAETGVKPLVYCNLSTIQSDVNGFKTIAEAGYKLWLAQYASNTQQVGFLPHPWQKGSYEPFKKITMHQYSGNGKINGYTGAVDLDIFYGTEAEWKELAGYKAAPEPEPAPTPTPEPDPTESIALLRSRLIKYMRKKISEDLDLLTFLEDWEASEK